jgi:hypothetical protein
MTLRWLERTIKIMTWNERWGDYEESYITQAPILQHQDPEGNWKDIEVVKETINA